MSDDWRTELLDMIPYLRGQSFVRKAYRDYRPGWDHDHCAVCGVKLAEPSIEGEGILHEGLGITADYSHGADYEWVCPACFEACKDQMGWRDATGGG